MLRPRPLMNLKRQQQHPMRSCILNTNLPRKHTHHHPCIPVLLLFISQLVPAIGGYGTCIPGLQRIHCQIGSGAGPVEPRLRLGTTHQCHHYWQNSSDRHKQLNTWPGPCMVDQSVHIASVTVFCMEIAARIVNSHLLCVVLLGPPGSRPDVATLAPALNLPGSFHK